MMLTLISLASPSDSVAVLGAARWARRLWGSSICMKSRAFLFSLMNPLVAVASPAIVSVLPYFFSLSLSVHRFRTYASWLCSCSQVAVAAEVAVDDSSRPWEARPKGFFNRGQENKRGLGHCNLRLGRAGVAQAVKSLINRDNTIIHSSRN